MEAKSSDMRGLSTWSAWMEQSPQPQGGHTKQSGKAQKKLAPAQATDMSKILTGERHCYDHNLLARCKQIIGKYQILF